MNYEFGVSVVCWLLVIGYWLLVIFTLGVGSELGNKTCCHLSNMLNANLLDATVTSSRFWNLDDVCYNASTKSNVPVIRNS
jgi:hypothetical protein